ncbi:MAG: HAMP domain-containing protein [Gammaproteobacteria bacterium]|nr:HAMP domain-containing protein [Gammaproteobacteria bacterium]NIM74043.1 HAMP domain-containing protein [Gammaproteobacteria bacterium]NIN38925.1 HAMP domain-containing protein [Gammaproteobacteria bacterium]NIO25818.1 HAMP domain-containing protein [Gammaproteobacteria bacterium]NIO66449.1 HAMP domain-containing protein [Gammaproteobacteria bacterium]
MNKLFSKFRIGPRLIFLITVQALILLMIGLTALAGLTFASRSTDLLNRNVTEGTRLSYLADTIQGELLATVHRVNTGALTWDQGRQNLGFANQQFEDDWKTYTTALTPDEAEFIEDVLAPGLAGVRSAFLELERLFKNEDRTNLSLFVINELDELVQPFLNALLASSSERQLASERTFEDSLKSNNTFLYASLAVIVIGVLLAGLIGYLIYRSIVDPIERISGTVHSVSEGDYEVRTGLTGSDEFATLGAALDELLQDKVTSLVNAEEENERLNESVLKLLDAVARLSERDLTVTVPVSADVTGPVADAINQMAEETGRVLMRVSRIASQVGASCATVNKKAEIVNATATAQKTEVERTASELAAASNTLVNIAKVARDCNETAKLTTETTQKAMSTVTGTLESMNEIREAIQETGKRIKRLGERSQEITAIVDIINTIAERTHVLALNAGMQAAAAGEAGRGFAVVADEVQRLAESSREATAQIASLVKNIQVDTNDTIVTMDRTISQVVSGSRMAESAGEQMIASQKTTASLVQSVGEIAASSEQQARISNELRERASSMLSQTQETSKELIEQLTQTKNLVQYARMLVQSVRVFKLPAQARS